MKKVLKSYGRAFRMQFNLKMILLSLLPSILALGMWGVVLFFSLQPLFDYLQESFVSSSSYDRVSHLLTFFGLLALKAFIVPLVAMWLLLPLMLITALVFVACVAMPVINQIISNKYFSGLERKRRAGWWRSLGFALLSLLGFLLVWTATLPLSLFFSVGIIVHPILIGWFTYRVMTYDALAGHATVEERRMIMERYRWHLWAVGIISGLISALPGMVWLGGVLWIFMLPVFAAIAIWMYVLVFMFSGMWFQVFCLEALLQLRDEQAALAPLGQIAQEQ